MAADWHIIFAVYLLIFTRIITFFVQAPIWGSRHMANQILLGTAAVISIMVLPIVKIPAELYNMTLFSFALMVINQAMVGLLIGFVSFLIMAAAQFAGELVDIQTGLSVAAAFDPASRGTVNLIRRFKFYFAMVVYLLLNGHHTLLKAVYSSFQIVPLEGVNFGGNIVAKFIMLTGELFYLGIQIASPVLAALFIIQVALGLLSRVAPQMNVFMLSFPLNIAVGMLLLWLALPVFYVALNKLFIKNDNDLHQILLMLGRR